MTHPDTKKILAALEHIHLSGDDRNIVRAGYVKVAEAESDTVRLVVDLPGALDQNTAAALQQQCEKAVKKLKGIKHATVVITASRPASEVSGLQPPARPAPPTPKPIPGVRHAIAVAAGKGGVGKSTVAVNLAVALAKLGHKVGLVDADIYGPSIARMMQLEGKPDIRDNKMVPPERYGVKCMSMALLLDENAPAVWRGPMATKALAQLVVGADWGELDYLVLDLPPGTGDIHLTIAQNFTLSGAVIVATPQEVALLDVRKAIGMFGKVGIPVLGVVENMSYFIDPNSGTKLYIFGQMGVKKMAEAHHIALLGEIPVEPLVSETSDSGEPITASHPDHAIAQAFMAIAKQVSDKLDK